MQHQELNHQGKRDRPLRLRQRLQQSYVNVRDHVRNLIQLAHENQRFARRSEEVRNHQLKQLIQQGHVRTLGFQVQRLLARDQMQRDQVKVRLIVQGLDEGDPLLSGPKPRLQKLIVR